MSSQKDKEYLSILVEPIKICASYKPKMGQGGKKGLGIDEFKQIYGADPFYHWFGLDHPLMYAAHKSAGGMTSIYRQIGLGCERLYRRILQDELGLTEDNSNWSYTIELSTGRKRKLSLDGYIPLEEVEDLEKKKKLKAWMLDYAKILGVNDNIASILDGIVFEVRQGYKSKDAKRQNADIANATTAYTKALLPCVLIFSTQIDEDIIVRYKHEKWAMLVGTIQDQSPFTSTYAFMKEILGYDLAGFLERNSETLKTEIEIVFRK